MNNKKIILITLIIIIFIIIFIILGNNRKQKPTPNNNINVEYPVIKDETLTYENRIFDQEHIHLIDIKIKESDWKDLLNNPLSKTKYKISAEIDGIKFENISFKTKGNSSLNHIYNGPKEGPSANRYSFKINFSKYDKEQTYFGLDKLNLNNIYGDATYLNDYITYEMFRSIGIPTPLTSFIFLRINGIDFGLYLGVEEIENSFLKRNNLEGNIYKPEQENGVDNGASLIYTNDNISNYSSIINNAQTTTNIDDHHRLIKSIEKLNKKEDLDNILDIEEIIKYFVVHNYVLSYDSYTGPSIHNYFLLENNSKLSILPWDYNLAFGKYNMGEDATFIINYGIDTPLYKAKEAERPLWNIIVTNEKYLNRYHELMNELLTDYLESGKLNEEIDKTYNLIKYYIENDPSAFYHKEEVRKATNTLKTFCTYRTKSIRLQLDGKLNTNTKKQNDIEKINASNININDLGLVANDKKEKKR